MVAGTTDGSADQFASGAREIGNWNTVLGTTLVLEGLARNRIADPLGRGVYCHLHPLGYWMPGGASNLGARALDERFPNADRQAHDSATLALSPTSLCVYPLFGGGERFPFNAPKARGFVEGEPASEAGLIVDGVLYRGHNEAAAKSAFSFRIARNSISDTTSLAR